MRCWYAVAAAIGCMIPQSAAAQEKGKEAPLAQIFADWKHRQGLLKTARYVISGTTEFHDIRLPTGPPVRPRRAVLLLDLAGQRYWLETSEEIVSTRGGRGVEFLPRVSTSAFDGKIGQAYYHRDINGLGDDGPDLSISTPSTPGTWFDAHLWPLLYAHGLVPTAHTDIRLDKPWPSYDPKHFTLMDGQLFHGRNCTVVQTHPRSGKGSIHDEFWIDIRERSTIHRHVYYAGSGPWYRLDVEWKQMDFGWQPEKWSLTWTRDGKVERISRLQVESFEPNPAVADSDFTLPAKPGMKVCVSENPPPDSGLNPYLPASETFRVLPSGDWQLIDAKGFTTEAGKVLPPARRPSRQYWVWWIIAPVVLAVGVGVYLIRRRSMGTAAQPPE